MLSKLELINDMLWDLAWSLESKVDDDTVDDLTHIVARAMGAAE